jgi:hypothetical protein
MNRTWSVVVCSLLFCSLAHGEAKSAQKRQRLAEQSRERITVITRTLTSVDWVARINELMAGTPGGKALGEKWNPTESHWSKAADEILRRVMKAFDDLDDAPEAHARMELPFQSNLTEAEAAEVLALSTAELQQVDDYADTLTLAVKLLEHRSDLKPGSPEYRAALKPLLEMSHLPELHDVPKTSLSAKTMNDYRHARTAAVDFLQTAIDGQLQLYFFDHSSQLLEIASKAAAAAGKTK